MASIPPDDSTRILESPSVGAFSIHIPGVAWIVETGRLDLFVIRVAEKEFEGARRHFISIEAGQAVFGMSSGSSGFEFGLLASPTPGTRFHCSPLEDLRTSGSRFDGTDDSSTLLENWISSLTRASGKTLFPNDVVELSPGEVLEVTGQARPFVSAGGLLWVQQVRGSSRFLNHPATSPIIYGEFFPLSQLGWLHPEPGSQIRAIDVQEWKKTDLEWRGLQNFHRTVLERLSFEQRLLREQERKQLLTQSGSDSAAFRGALQSLAVPLLQPDEYPATSLDEGGRQPLIQVCDVIGKALGAKMAYPLELIHGRKLKDPIAAIAKASALRSRVVALKGKWWTDGNAPLVAFRDKDNSPVALLPAKAKGYELFDPADLRTTKVSATVALTLNGFAHTFYRPLPDEKLSASVLLSYGLRDSKRELSAILLLGIGSGLLSLSAPVATGILFNSIIPGAQRSELLLMAAFLFMSTWAATAFSLTRSLAILRLEGKLGSSLQAALWDRLLRLPVPFFRGFSSGDLAERSLGIEYIIRMLTGSALTTILSGLFSFFSFLLLFYYSWQLALVAGALTFVALSVSVITTYLQVRYQRALLKLRGKISGMLLGFVDSIAKLRVSGSEPRLFGVWAREFAAQKMLSIRARRVSNALAVFDSAFPVISLAVIFGFTVRLMGQPLLHSLSTGSFLAFMVAFIQFQTAALQLSTTIESVIGIVPLYERAAPIFAAQPEVRSVSKNPGVLTGWIEINHLDFHYPQATQTVLRDVSISVKPGQFVAIVGHSGSGKSTLLRLLLGFEKPDSGAIYFDGQHLAGLDIEAVRRQMGVVIQSARLVKDSIFGNIAGSAALTFDDAWEAARLAGLEGDIRQMPMGMHTLVSEGGGNLSGGQRQRLLIARAMAKKPRIFVFDEATSALDNVTQAKVARSLDAFQATRIVVAHRLSTIVNADRIFVLEKGVITQCGSYDQLLKEDGLFRDLATRQLT
jgi:NHLM bacteriocin system ABC transporter ATP-binding protein